MQARILSAVAALAILATTSALAQQNVQTQPAEASRDFFLKLGGVEGESEPPPPPPPPPPPSNGAAPVEQMSLNFEKFEHPGGGRAQDVAAPPEAPAALIVPAIQRARDAAPAAPATTPADVAPRANGTEALIVPAVQRVRDAAAGDPQPLVPEQPICAHCGSDIIQSQAQEPQPVVPELPICGHCGSEVAAAPAPATAEEEEQPRRRRVFSLSIGGVTVSSDGGVAVAAGEINGDGRGARRGGGDAARQPARATGRR